MAKATNTRASSDKAQHTTMIQVCIQQIGMRFDFKQGPVCLRKRGYFTSSFFPLGHRTFKRQICLKNGQFGSFKLPFLKPYLNWTGSVFRLLTLAKEDYTRIWHLTVEEDLVCASPSLPVLPRSKCSSEYEASACLFCDLTAWQFTTWRDESGEAESWRICPQMYSSWPLQHR